MKELSIFIDESGDFGFSNGSSKYYSITLLFHDQSKDISDNIKKITEKLGDKEPVHSGPLIRRESPYYEMPIQERRKIFNAIYFFSSTSPITYLNLVYKKKDFEDSLKLQGKMSRDLYSNLFNKQEKFLLYDIIKIYYDNGQYQITSIINNVFSILGFNYEIKRVSPVNYRLFQAADFICTLELIKHKLDNKDLSKSETIFFYSLREFKNYFYRSINKKRIK